MGNALLQEKPLLGANFSPRPKTALERAADRWFTRGKPPSSTTTASDKTVPGQYFDSETGLNYVIQRYFDTSTGRFITSDRIGLTGGINTYGYALQNPINYYDPNGESAEAAAATWGTSSSFAGLAPAAKAAATAAGWAAAAGAAGWAGWQAGSWAYGMYGEAFWDWYFDDTDAEDCPDDEYCRKEKERCSELCAEVISDPDRSHVYGGSITQCILNCLPEKCGGEPKWKGYR